MTEGVDLVEQEMATPRKSAAQSVIKTSLLIFGFLVAGKILNFLKKIMIGHLFGVSSVADAFFAAGHLPYYLAIFFEGFLFLVFMPEFSKIRKEKGEAEARHFTRAVLLAVSLLTGLIVALFYFFAPFFVREFVPGFTVAEQNLTVSLFRTLGPVLIFISLCFFFQTLNSYFGRYRSASSAGMTDTAIMILMTLACWKFWGIHAAAVGSVIGAFCAFMIQWFIYRRYERIFCAGFYFRVEWFARLFWVLLPMSLVWLFQQVPFVILNRFGSGMYEGTISSLNIALAITVVPMALVNQTVLFAIFPTLARQSRTVAGMDSATTFFQTLRTSFLLLLPFGLLLSVFALPLARIFFGGGGIDPEGTTRIANSLACLAWVVPLLYAELFMTQTLITIRRIKAAILLCASRAMLTYAFCYYFTAAWDYQGLALGFSAALLINFVIFFPVMLRKTPLSGEWGKLFVFLGKLAVACLPIVACAIYSLGRPHFLEGSTVLTSLIVMGGASTGLVLIYLGILRVQRVEEIAMMLKRKAAY